MELHCITAMLAALPLTLCALIPLNKIQRTIDKGSETFKRERWLPLPTVNITRRGGQDCVDCLAKLPTTGDEPFSGSEEIHRAILYGEVLQQQPND